MIVNDLLSIKHLIIHKVGNKVSEEGVFLSKSHTFLNQDIEKWLIQYFLTPFKSDETFNFYHESDLELNEVYVFSKKVFENPDTFVEQSQNLAKHLYEASTHPKIKGGEFFVVYFKDCIQNGVSTDAIGLFKSENKDSFLKPNYISDKILVDYDSGINVQKLDKGCIIFNMEAETGFVVSVIDNTGKGTDAQYWNSRFLNIYQRKDNYFLTQSALSLCKDFVTMRLPDEFNVSKADQAELLSKSVKYFKEKDNFIIEDFTKEVIKNDDLIQSFNNYKTDFETENELEIETGFDISNSAVKKQARVFKSVIKLDKNFHIYVHGRHEYIKKGYDQETGMHFYQLFFKNEE